MCAPVCKIYLSHAHTPLVVVGGVYYTAVVVLLPDYWLDTSTNARRERPGAQEVVGSEINNVISS